MRGLVLTTRGKLVVIICTVAVGSLLAMGVLTRGDGSSSGVPSSSVRTTQDPIEGLAACSSGVPPPPLPKSYPSAPTQSILDTTVDYRAVIQTSCGDIKVDLLEDTAPLGVANFIFLAEEGFYDGLIWHHVQFDSIIQTGDPNGQNGLEPDDPGYLIQDELPESNDAYTYGAVGYANTGRPDTSGSQFFIVVHDLVGATRGQGRALELDRGYTVFARVLEKSFPVTETIARQRTVSGGDPVESVKPVVRIYIEAIEIIRRHRG